jgi:4-amino-4-deoxy-L-arabinose transferase-like glycosyltransferase
MHEPTVLDYLKSRLAFGKKTRVARIELPPLKSVDKPTGVPASPIKTVKKLTAISDQSGVVVDSPVSPIVDQIPEREEKVSYGIPWLAFGSLLLALIAQFGLEPPRLLEPSHLNVTFAVVFYVLSVALLIIGYTRREIRLAPLRAPLESNDRPFRIEFLFFGLAFGVLAFLTFSQDVFTELNLILWLLAIILTMLAFWSDPKGTFSAAWNRINSLFHNIAWRKVIPRLVLVLVICAVILFFRLSQLDQVPPEMVSDHTEKLLDVLDILHGLTPVYFARNTGREFFQFYWTVLVIKLFKTGVTFYSLKLGTALAGLLTLPYVYLLGKEYANRRVGLLAVLFTGLAYWPNVISRLGLRFPFYPLFVAPALFYMLRGLRRQTRNDFIWAGLALGIGLHGYTSFRIVPILIVIGFILFLLHKQTADNRRRAVAGLAVIALISLVVFIPLLRYAVNNPEMFAYRTMTRVGSLEQPLPGPAWIIFLQNLWKAITMFNFSDGEIWVHSVTFRPALDLVSAGLFIIGLILMVSRYVTRRLWQDLFLILSIPILMLPSILSLAFPAENPCLNRTAGAIIPVFLIIALAMDSLMASIQARLSGIFGKVTGFTVASILVILSGIHNYDLVFNQYYPVYQRSTWNTSEMGEVIQQFAQSGGSLNSAWLVGYPYWADSRAVGITAGYAGHDYAIWPEEFTDTLAVKGPKLFLVNTQDTNSLALLAELYPTGDFTIYQSKVETKNFFIFNVP